MLTLYLDQQTKNGATLEDVEHAVRNLDGAARTVVVVALPSGQTLTVGGGPDRFVAEVAASDKVRWATVDPTQGDEPVKLVVGGQIVDYPARVCVTREVVLDAARTFVRENGVRNQNLSWSIET